MSEQKHKWASEIERENLARLTSERAELIAALREMAYGALCPESFDKARELLAKLETSQPQPK